jgi:hypothetical protein
LAFSVITILHVAGEGFPAAHRDGSEHVMARAQETLCLHRHR